MPPSLSIAIERNSSDKEFHSNFKQLYVVSSVTRDYELVGASQALHIISHNEQVAYIPVTLRLQL